MTSMDVRGAWPRGPPASIRPERELQDAGGRRDAPARHEPAGTGPGHRADRRPATADRPTAGSDCSTARPLDARPPTVRPLDHRPSDRCPTSERRSPEHPSARSRQFYVIAQLYSRGVAQHCHRLMCLHLQFALQRPQQLRAAAYKPYVA